MPTSAGTKRAVAAGAGVALAVLGWSWLSVDTAPLAGAAPRTLTAPAPTPPPEASGEGSAPPASASRLVRVEPAGAEAGLAELASLTQEYEQRLAQMLDTLADVAEPQSLRAELAQLKADMLAGPPEAAAAALLAFLDSGRDAFTGLPFAVGPDGAMATVPSLRTFALDVLPSVEPTMAVAVSRAVLDEAASDVESALALRNLAWNDLDGDMASELAQRFRRFVDDERWAQQASDAYVQAFDVAVELAQPSLFSKLSALLARPGSDAAKTVADAAFIALDRQVVKDHNILLDALASDPQLLSSAPMARASLMARLDMTVARERAAVLDYLGSTISRRERDYFGKLYPNGNYFYGNWLVSASEATPSIADQHAQDRATLAEIERLLGAAPTVPVRETLARVRERLLVFETGTAATNGQATSAPLTIDDRSRLPAAAPRE